MDQYGSNFSFKELAQQANNRQKRQQTTVHPPIKSQNWHEQLKATANYLLTLNDADQIWQLERFRQDMNHLPNYLLDQLYHILFEHMLDYERFDLPQKNKEDALYQPYLELFKKVRGVKLARLRTKSQASKHQINLSRHYSKQFSQG